MMMMMDDSDHSSVPVLPEDSPGSSVSSRMQDEYEELLKYAVVVPSYDPRQLPKTLSDFRGTFPGFDSRIMQRQEQAESEHGEEEEDQQQEEDTVTEDGISDVGDGASSHGVDQVPDRLVNGDIPQSTPRQDRPPAQSRYPPLYTDSEVAKLAGRLFENEQGRPQSPALSLGGLSMEDSPTQYSSGVDSDVSRMENLLDQWTGELKRNVLAEFGQSKIRMLEQHRYNMIKEKEKHCGEVTKLQNEIESMKELLHTYEVSIERKDQVISNLTNAMGKQKERYDMLKTFCEWKIRHNDQKREAFSSTMAQKHYERTLQQKVWDAWHSVIEDKWRGRVEKACQAKAQEVCMQLTNDYEARIKSLNEALEAAREEVGRLHEERERYEETMKKAFMRGVCALNLEAMSMFQESEQQQQMQQQSALNTQESEGQRTQGTDTYFGDTASEQLATYPHMTISQEPVYTSDPPGAPPPRIVTASRSSMSQIPGNRGAPMIAKGKPGVKGKVITAKVTGRTDTSRSSVLGGQSTLNPPMSSVLVERHQPIVKQTIGQATANKYPVKGSQSVIAHRKIAGQSGQMPVATPNIQTVKVVD